MKKHCVKLTAVVMGLLMAMSAFPAQPEPEHHIESTFQNAVRAFINNDPMQSMQHLQSLLTIRPEFAPAQILHAELLTTYAHQNTLLSMPEAIAKNRVNGVAQETIARIRYQAPPKNYLPENIMQLSDIHDYALLLDASHSRIYIFRNVNNKPHLIADYYASIGKGGMGKTQENDSKTPTGVYQINGHLSAQNLPELYGEGAYTLNYPNDWDRLADRNGYGIWLHGTPRNMYSRPPQDSRGCVILSNHLVKTLKQYVTIDRTPVILAQQVTWLAPTQWEKARQELLTTIEQWKSDWEARDINKYLSYYSSAYRTQHQDYHTMSQQARYHAKRKEYVKVKVENLDLFRYPNATDDIVIAVFDQEYRSNNHNSEYRKQQFWKNEDAGWKIVYAGQVLQ